MAETGLAVQTTQTNNEKLYESLALKGDLSGLSPKEKAAYYGQLCERLGIDAATKPFDILKLNGKEVMYATKGATDQLAKLHNLNREIVKMEIFQDILEVTITATLPSGRTETDIGCVSIGGLKGDALCNARMKSVTKAKRRTTLAILGLGVLDESELETIPQNKIEISLQPPDPYMQEVIRQFKTPTEDSAQDADAEADTNAMRIEMQQLLKDAGKAMGEIEGALSWFDAASTEKRAEGLRRARISVIKTVIGEQDWDLSEIKIYLDGFGVEALENAEDSQLTEILADMRTSKML